jgi:hypothetical protein
MYQLVEPKSGRQLPEVCIGIITSFQDQRDSFFLCRQPERYFWEYHEGEGSPQYNIHLMKNLRILYCCWGWSNFTDSHLSRLVNLKELYCKDNIRFTDKGLVDLVNLQVLDCCYNKNFTDKGLTYLVNLKKLNCILNKNFTEVGLARLINLQELLYSSKNKNQFKQTTLSKIPKVHDNSLPGIFCYLY